MKIDIYPVKSEGEFNKRFIVRIKTDLPYQKEVKEIISTTLLQHPFNKKVISREIIQSLKIDLQVVVNGNRFQYYRDLDIDYDSFLENKSNPVKIVIHFFYYLGQVDPSSKELQKKLDREGLKGHLYHEFGHLIDALDPKFKYRKLKNSLRGKIKDYIMYLWNCYIDRRLRKELGFTGKYSYKRRVFKNGRINEATKEILESEKNLSYPELVQIARSMKVKGAG